MTGHGNVIFSDEEAANLRKYLVAGGFLHIDDNYGMDVYVRREMKKVFPELDLLNCHFRIQFTIRNTSFRKGSLKYMSMMGNDLKDLSNIQREISLFLHTTNAIWEMVGKILKSITIQSKSDRKL
jgi:hypothetical protein